jgi:hypothetical protein
MTPVQQSNPPGSAAPDRTSTATQAPVPWRPARNGFDLCITSPVSLRKDRGIHRITGVSLAELDQRGRLYRQHAEVGGKKAGSDLRCFITFSLSHVFARQKPR